MKESKTTKNKLIKNQKKYTKG